MKLTDRLQSTDLRAKLALEDAVAVIQCNW